MSMVSALIMAIKAFKKNVTKEVAQMSGGEYTTFTGDKRFEQRVVDAAKHMRNRYLITFSPSDPSPGLHTIRVTNHPGLRSADRRTSQLLAASGHSDCHAVCQPHSRHGCRFDLARTALIAKGLLSGSAGGQ